MKKINIEKEVLKNIKTLRLDTIRMELDNNQTLIKLYIGPIIENKNWSNLYLIYFKHLETRYNNDIRKVYLHILKRFININKVLEIKDYKNTINDLEINRLNIKLNNNKEITINVPIHYYNSEFENLISKLISDIKLNELKTHTKDKVEENIFDMYTENDVDNLIIFSSEILTSSQLYKEKQDNKKSLYCFTNGIKQLMKKIL